MIDPHSGELRYASAGHPPVFVRSRGGVSELSSTTFLLGAVDDSMFGDEEGVVRLEEGDTMVLFTDGAYDARNPRGERFGLERLREIMQRSSAPPSWTQYLMRLVETFEAGMPEDDLLIAEVTFFSRRSLSSITGDDLPMPAEAYAGARA
jgi:serine phosphatase RsbU (regulator of sigma subunit)